MERLSSCYFCGDAVDAALETYPLVPEDYDPEIDTGRQVVLCPTCRRKLTTVIEHVLEAAFDGSKDLDASADVLTDVDADESMIATSVERIEDPADAGSVDPDATSVDDDDTDVGKTDAGTDADGESEEMGWASPVTGSGSNGSGDSAGESDGSDADTSTESDTSTGASRDEYTRREYNKIVRLLQNRDFPVEIEEIVVVARNAYGIDEPTCHAVLNALVERGVLADEGEQVVKG